MAANATTGLTAVRCFTLENCVYLPQSLIYDRHLLDTEKTFDFCSSLIWMATYWKICFVFIGPYLMLIFAGQRYMRSRPPWRLKGVLLAWNVALAVFSIFATWRCVPAVLYNVGQVGLYDSVCGGGTRQYQQSVSMYLWWFSLSKFVELGDTAFIVLRKTPLIFLHWFHHATVCFFVWSSSAYPSAVCIFYMTMNFAVHSVMYSYYSLKVLKIRVPKPISMGITSLQLLQMVGGVAVTLYARRMKATPGVGCCVFDEAINIALTIYFAYFVLFLNFFVRSYVFAKPASLARKKVE